MNTPPSYLGIVVPHTHWDRAWYNTFEQFRIVLVDRLSRLLDLFESDPDFTCFVFDGQMVPFEDYLEIRPADWDRITAEVEAGRLVVGPWYVLPDEFLVSGESLVRNLLIGMRTAEAMGRCMKVGYIPDPFGHISQLPQILQGFGIDSAIFARGLGPESERLGIEFRWESPCPKKGVLAVHMIGSYINLHAWGVPLPEPIDTDHINMHAAETRLAELVAEMRAAGPSTRWLLFSNGMDHYPAQPALPSILREMNRRQHDVLLRQGSFEDFVRAVQKDKPRLEKHAGELHSGTHHFLLSGVFSARMPLKQENARCQNLLETVAEPLATWAWLRGREYPAGLFDYAWRTLLKNHPHDDICGCSVDSVHEDMVPRFRHAREVGERIAATSLADFCGAPGAGLSLHVFNPHPETRDIPIILRQENVRVHTRLSSEGVFLDEEGLAIPARLIVSGERASVLRRDGEELPVWWYDLEVRALARQVPGLGLVEYRYEPDEIAMETDGVACGANWIGNEHLKLSAARDGSLTLRCKATGRRLSGLHRIEDEADAGDEYDFSPLAEHHKVLSTRGLAAHIETETTPCGCAELRIAWKLTVPAGLDRSRSKRASRQVRLEISTVARLYSGSRRVEFTTEFNNTADDHRVRVVFPTDVAAKTSLADSAFDVVERPVDLPESEGWRQPPVCTQHTHSRVLVQEGERGVALFHRGTPEFEARRTRGRLELCLTLLRCVGWLSKSDLATRPGHAGPEFATPGAQCRGPRRFEYALHLFDGEEARAGALSEGRAYAVGSYARLSIASDLKTVGGLLTLEGEGIELSVVKRAADRDSVIVRLWNTGAARTQAAVAPAFRIKEAHRTDLAEQREKKLPIGRGRRVRIPMQPKEIVTLELVPDLSAPFGEPRRAPRYGVPTRLP